MWPDIHSDVEVTRKASEAYLKLKPDLDKKLEECFWAFNSLGALIPETLERIGSGHYFPYSEAFYNLQISFELSIDGLYSYSLTALRTVLELSVVSIYYDINDDSQVAIQPWLQSGVRTPPFRIMLNELFKLNYFKEFESRFELRKELENAYDGLGSFTHVRGQKSSSAGMSKGFVVSFQPKALERYVQELITVQRLISIVSLLKYPIGLVPLPLTEKFGLNGPVGGFLEEDEVNRILAFLKKDEVAFLRNLVKSDDKISKVIKYFESLPDITEGEFQMQSKNFDRSKEGNRNSP